MDVEDTLFMAHGELLKCTWCDVEAVAVWVSATSAESVGGSEVSGLPSRSAPVISTSFFVPREVALLRRRLKQGMRLLKLCSSGSSKFLSP